MNCIFCNELIDESNDSEEHLILQAIGGRKKVSGLLCRNCNSRKGNDWDSVLAKQLAPLCSQFSIRRESGEVQPVKVTTSAGATFYRQSDGSLLPERPIYQKTSIGDGTAQIQIQARTIEEARLMVEGVARNYPTIDVEKALASAKVEQKYLDEYLKLSITGVGGDVAGCSIVASAFCLAASLGIDPQSCTDADSFLKNAGGEGPFALYYQRDLLQERPKAMPLHCLAVSNRGTDGQLLAYAEFFAIYRFIVRLAANYKGPDIHAAYAINPMSGKELDVSFELGLSRADIAASFAGEHVLPDSFKAAFDEVMPVAMQNDFKRERERVSRAAMKYAFENCGAKEGETLTAEHINKISRLAAEKLAPFLIRHLRRGPPAP